MNAASSSIGLSEVSALSEQELVARVRSLNADGNRLLAVLLVHLGEMDARKLYKRHACSSMFAFCRRLGMSEGSTARRLDSARSIRRFPKLLPLVERGELHLTALSIVSGILTPANVDSVIAAVRGKSRREVEEIRVRYAPRPDVKDMIRKQPQPAFAPAPTLSHSEPAPTSITLTSAASTPPVTVPQSMPDMALPEQRSLLDAVAPVANVARMAAIAPPVFELTREQATPMPLSVASAPPPVAAPAVRSARPVPPIVPLREDGYKVQFMATKAIVEKIDRLKEMMRHRNSRGDLAVIVEAALDLLIEKSRSSGSGGRHVRRRCSDRASRAMCRPRIVARCSSATASSARGSTRRVIAARSADGSSSIIAARKAAAAPRP